MSFQMYIQPILQRGDIEKWNATRPMQNQSHNGNASPIIKKELQAFLGIINYLSKFSPSTATVCKFLQKLTSSKAVWMWNASYQDI